jgi:ABC-2 type transport system permease protein
MTYLRLIDQFLRASIQEEVSYRANFWINLLHSLLNLATGVLGIYVLFAQIEKLNGWGFPETLMVLGVYLTVQALRNLFIGPSLDALAGMDGEVWSGNLDFTLIRPVNIQFLASFRRWHIFSLFVTARRGILVYACLELNAVLPPRTWLLPADLDFPESAPLCHIAGIFRLVFWVPG